MDKDDLFNCSTDRAFSKIKKYWEINEKNFPGYYQKYFKSNIFEMIEQNDINIVDDITKSIFSYLGILSFNYDEESQFLSFFEQYFGLDNLYNKNILDVTQMYVPSLAKKIADEKSKIKASGLIKAVGPNVGHEETNYESSKKGFSSSDASKVDMIVSFAPREVAERILVTAVELNKELLLNFDGYIPDNITSQEAFINKLFEYASNFKDYRMDLDIVNYSENDKMALVLKRK